MKKYPLDSPQATTNSRDLHLAFDVGHSSIGWAVLQTPTADLPQLLGCGAVIFQADDCLASQRRGFRRPEITAPETGVILSTARRFPGEKIEAGATLFKIADADRTELRLYATEDRINLIQPGQLVRFRANNNPDRLAPLRLGRVTRVARDRDLSASEDSTASGSYRVAVEIEKEPYPLAVGAIVEAEIVLERRPFWRLLFLKSQPGTEG